jgi:5,10-methylenetetrahydromethanopterin reductase
MDPAAMRSGVVLQGVDDPGAFGDLAARVEELGYDALWLTDSSLHARNCWSYLTLAALRTSTVALGTAVTNPLTRHPGITAVAAATVDEVSGGRLVLGMGAGDRPLLALGRQPASVASVRATVAATRALLAGETVTEEAPDFTLDDAHLRFPARADLPIYLSASGPRMLELAGEVADGVILLAGLHGPCLAWAVAQVDRGAAAAGRPRPHVAVFAYGAIDEDEERALAAARPIAAWFPQTAPRYCELAGLDPDLAEATRRAYAGGEFQEAADAAAALPDEFVRRMALGGGRARARAQLAEVFGAGVDSVHVFPLGDDRIGTIEAFAEVVRHAEPEPAAAGDELMTRGVS